MNSGMDDAGGGAGGGGGGGEEGKGGDEAVVLSAEYLEVAEMATEPAFDVNTSRCSDGDQPILFAVWGGSSLDAPGHPRQRLSNLPRWIKTRPLEVASTDQGSLPKNQRNHRMPP